jgi:hypothetical protein
MPQKKKYKDKEDRLKAKREQSKEYYKTKGKVLKKEYHKKNKAKILAYKKKKYYENREKFLQVAKEYRNRPNVKKRMHSYVREYWIKNKDKIRETIKKYEINNKEYLKSKKKEYAKKNKSRLRAIARERVRGYYKNNPQFKLKEYLRNRVREVLKEQKTIKSKSTFELIGCSPKKLRNHIEKLFKKNMSWDNYGKWHVDHIVPCSRFNLVDKNQQKICFNYKNLQPMWAKENISKSNKII